MASTTNEKKKHKCGCGSEFRQPAGLSRHKKNCKVNTSKQEVEHKCSKCNKVFNRKDNRDTHFKTCNPNKLKVPPCSICGKKFGCFCFKKRILPARGLNIKICRKYFALP